MLKRLLKGDCPELVYLFSASKLPPGLAANDEGKPVTKLTLVSFG